MMRNKVGLRAKDAELQPSPARSRRAPVKRAPGRNASGGNDGEHKLGATARSFAILEHVASSGTPVDVLDIIGSLKLPKATAYRLVDWFVVQGYLSREPG